MVEFFTDSRTVKIIVSVRGRSSRLHLRLWDVLEDRLMLVF
jgi:hypothetical protein